MRTLFLPRGWVDELRAALVERGRCWGYLHLFRGTRFTTQEAAAIRALVKDLAVAIRKATIDGSRDPSRGPPKAPGVLVVGDDGHMIAATASGAAVVAQLPCDAAAHGGLPHAVVVVAEEARARAAVAESHVITPTGVVRVVATAEAGVAVVVSDRAHPRAAIDLALALHALSPREEEVCRAMLSGLSDDAIALTLGVETETVKSHGKSLFAKLGVEGRSGLLRWLRVAG
jgi:DNA-binding CsgD family transcriptional regulator